jgi:hypothetical protein
LYSRLVSIWRQKHKKPMRQQILVYDTKPHVTHPVALYTQLLQQGIPHKLFLGWRHCGSRQIRNRGRCDYHCPGWNYLHWQLVS